MNTEHVASDAAQEQIAKMYAHIAAEENPAAWGYWDIGGGQSAACPEHVREAIAMPENGPPSAIQAPQSGDTCEVCGKVA